jgi:hypothetical protein
VEFLAWFVLVGSAASIVLTAFVPEERIFAMFGVQSWPEVWSRIGSSRAMAVSVALGIAAEVAALALAVAVLV